MNCCCKDRDCDYNPCDKPAKWEVEILYTPPHGLTYYLCEKHFSEMEQFLHPYDNVKRIEVKTTEGDMNNRSIQSQKLDGSL